MKGYFGIAVCAMLAGGCLNAAPVTFTGASGNLAASATFASSGGNLVVMLTNTAGAATMVPADLLTAVYFSVDGTNPSMTPVSALLPSGSQTCVGGACVGASGLNVGGEWAYQAGLSGGLTQEFGISSTGLGVFSDPNFNGLNLDGPEALNGMQYGITAMTMSPNNGLGSNPVIRNSVVFTLSGWGGLDPAAKISSVLFQYGTDLSEPQVPGDPRGQVPEPATMGLLGAGLTGLALLRRRKA